MRMPSQLPPPPRPRPPFVPLSRAMVARAVATLFVNGNGDRATRLVLMDESAGQPGRDLGGLCERAAVDDLCRDLGVSS